MICSLGNSDDSSNVESVCANEGKFFFIIQILNFLAIDGYSPCYKL